MGVVDYGPHMLSRPVCYLGPSFQDAQLRRCGQRKEDIFQVRFLGLYITD